MLLHEFGTQGFYGFDRESGDRHTIVDNGWNWAGQFHPDDDWIVYSTFKVPGGRDTEIWLVPFPGPGAPRQLSFGGGSEPRWSLARRRDLLPKRDPRDGDPRSEKRDGDLVTGRPRTLFEDRFLHNPNPTVPNFELNSDGRLVMVEPAEEGDQTLILVQNWRAKVERAFAGEMAP